MANSEYNRLVNKTNKNSNYSRYRFGRNYVSYSNNDKDIRIEKIRFGKKYGGTDYYLKNTKDKTFTKLSKKQYKSLLRSEVYSSRNYFIPRLILIIIMCNLMGVSSAIIDSKKYIPVLDNSAVYYDVDYVNGVITKLDDVNTLGVYNNDGHIIQNVYHYDWVNKFKQLDKLRPVFKFDTIPAYNNDPYQYIDNFEYFKKFITPYGRSLDYYNNAYNLLNNKYASFVLNSENGFYYLQKTSNIYFTDFDNNSINWINEVIDKQLVDNMDTQVWRSILNFIIYPVSIAYNFGYDLFIIGKFIISW